MGKKLICVSTTLCRSRWPRGVRCGSAAARWIELWVWIPHGAWSLSVVSVVCYQVEVSASGWSLVLRSPTECGVSNVCDREASMRRPWLPRGCCALGGNSTTLPMSAEWWQVCFRDLISTAYYLISIYLSRMLIRPFSLKRFLAFGSAISSSSIFCCCPLCLVLF
jgi:hypothetical protein